MTEDFVRMVKAPDAAMAVALVKAEAREAGHRVRTVRRIEPYTLSGSRMTTHYRVTLAVKV